MIDSKRIAKNSIFLYARMLLLLFVSLFTSRVILDKLGVEDFALHGVVGGIVGLFAFLNGTLSLGSSRFVAFSLGKGDNDNLKRTFGTIVIAHLILTLIIVLFAETVGIWYLNNKLVVSPERFNAAFWVFQISVFTTVLSTNLVPQTAVIMAHERMDIYAYFSIFQALANLFIVYLLTLTSFDRLIFLSALMAIVQVVTFIVWFVYTRVKFQETRGKLLLDKKILRSLLSFSGWNVIANSINMLMTQGILLLLNLFFPPYIVASQTLSGRFSIQLMQFVNNLRVSIDPQVIKLYAAGNKDESKRLTLQSSLYTFDLLLLLGLPCILVAEKLMSIWLVDVPDYAVIFVQYAILRNILSNFNVSFYTPMMASGRLKKNSIAAAIIGFAEFGGLYLLFKLGFGAMWVCYIPLIAVMVSGYLVKPYILFKDEGYNLKELLLCYYNCVKVAIPAVVVSILAFLFIPQNTFLQSIIVAFISASAVLVFSYVFMEKTARKRLYSFVKAKIKR